eukprot:jgi/Psemu1/28206/gm1.28206_g
MKQLDRAGESSGVGRGYGTNRASDKAARFNEAVGAGRYGERVDEAGKASGGDNVDRVKRAGSGTDRRRALGGSTRQGCYL